MKKYISYFRLWLVMGLQYRAAAFGGVVTQFFWGFMELIAMHAFYSADPAAFPMSMEAMCSYVWLKQALFALLCARTFDGQILNSVQDGQIAYELCRPIHIYDIWYARSAASRISRAGLRCLPILAVAVFLPESYRLSAPADLTHFVFFGATLLLALAVVAAYTMLIYLSGFYTLSSEGIRICSSSLSDFLTGGLIPLPFFPEKVQRILEFTPFASMQNVPLRIYSGSLTGTELYRALFLQIFWLAVLTSSGRLLCRRAERKITIQGG